MKIPETTSTTTTEVGLCIACKKPLLATVDFKTSDFRIEDGVGARVNVKVVGINISHDCRPKATR